MPIQEMLRDVGLIPGWRRFSGLGKGNPLQYSCLENSMDRGVWWATVHRAAKSWTVLSISTDKVWQQTKIRLNRNDLESWIKNKSYTKITKSSEHMFVCICVCLIYGCNYYIISNRGFSHLGASKSFWSLKPILHYIRM